MLYPELPRAATIDVPANERRAPGTADLLDVESLLSDGVIGHKGGGLIAAFDFVGLPHDATEEAELDQAEDQLVRALSDFGSGWVIHFDFQRFPTTAYPCRSVATDPAAQRIETIRRASFLEQPQFASTTTIWLTYLAERSTRRFFTQPGRDIAVFEAALETFRNKVAQATRLRRLEGDDLIGRLRAALRFEPPRPIALHPAARLDTALAPSLERLASGTLRVGETFAVPFRLTALPKRLLPGVMLPVTTSRLPLRLTTRMVMLSAWHADEAIRGKRRRRETNQFSWAWLLRTFRSGRDRARQAAREAKADGLAADEQFQTDRIRETHQALQASYGDSSFAYFVPALFALGASESEARDHADQLLALLRSARLDAEPDRFNEVQSYLAAAPGNAWANQRRYFQPLQAALALQPLTSTWEGNRESPHPILQGGPLAVVRGDTHEAFYLNLHSKQAGFSDLGHTLVLGPSGAGKSVLLNFLAASARRYPGARVISLDIDRSQKVHCLAAEGAFFDLGNDALQFAPLFLLRERTPETRTAVLTWLMTLWDATHQEPIPDADAEHLADGLDEVASLTPDLHTLEVLATKVQSPRLRTLLARYSDRGEHAGLFSGHANAIEARTPYTVIELSTLLRMRPEAKVPAFVHLQQLITHALDGRPAWILIDEGAHFLDEPILAASLRAWLVKLRKHNASVVFATQSLAHFHDPALRQLFSESCPTKIYLPNPAAASQHDVRTAYQAAGLSDRQIDRLATAQAKKHYLLVQPDGERLIDLALTPEELAILGASTPQALARVKALRTAHPGNWLERWIVEAMSPTSNAPTSQEIDS